MADKVHCQICGRVLVDERCHRCHERECVVCGHPVYKDESYRKIDEAHYQHSRCASGPKARPITMIGVEG